MIVWHWHWKNIYHLQKLRDKNAGEFQGLLVYILACLQSNKPKPEHFSVFCSHARTLHRLIFFFGEKSLRLRYTTGWLVLASAVATHFISSSSVTIQWQTVSSFSISSNKFSDALATLWWPASSRTSDMSPNHGNRLVTWCGWSSAMLTIQKMVKMFVWDLQLINHTLCGCSL